jgi:antitoxin ParD1/3/4
MSITLNPEQETIIANLIATGGFQTADEVLQVALKLLEQERHSYQLWLTETREQVKEGIESLDRGEGVDGETVVNDLLAKLRQVKLSELPMADKICSHYSID